MSTTSLSLYPSESGTTHLRSPLEKKIENNNWWRNFALMVIFASGAVIASTLHYTLKTKPVKFTVGTLLFLQFSIGAIIIAALSLSVRPNYKRGSEQISELEAEQSYLDRETSDALTASEHLAEQSHRLYEGTLQLREQVQQLQDQVNALPPLNGSFNLQFPQPKHFPVGHINYSGDLS